MAGGSGCAARGGGAGGGGRGPVEGLRPRGRLESGAASCIFGSAERRPAAGAGGLRFGELKAASGSAFGGRLAGDGAGGGGVELSPEGRRLDRRSAAPVCRAS